VTGIGLPEAIQLAILCPNMARQVQEESDPKRAVPATNPQDSSSDDEVNAADKALAAMGYAPVSVPVYKMVTRLQRVDQQ
jgi:hypothetical protein